jgi:hypothetical protein
MVASMFMTALATAAIPVGANAQQRGPAVSVGSNDLGGVVRSAEGPEAGVWVIHAIRKDCRHRRSRPLSDSGPAKRQLPSLGPRLRAR